MTPTFQCWLGIHVFFSSLFTWTQPTLKCRTQDRSLKVSSYGKEAMTEAMKEAMKEAVKEAVKEEVDRQLEALRKEVNPDLEELASQFGKPELLEMVKNWQNWERTANSPGRTEHQQCADDRVLAKLIEDFRSWKDSGKRNFFTAAGLRSRTNKEFDELIQLAKLAGASELVEAAEDANNLDIWQQCQFLDETDYFTKITDPLREEEALKEARS